MAKAYSLDLRERVFDLLAKGKSKLFIEETLGVATKTILKSLKNSTSHIKKRFRYEERREDLREEYQKILNQIPKENLIYLDESGFDLNMKKEYSWKTRGKRIYDNILKHKFIFPAKKGFLRKNCDKE